MKRTILLAVVSTLILASYQYSPAASSKGNDEAEIKALEQRIVDGAKARDVDAVMKNYVDDDSLLVFDVIQQMNQKDAIASALHPDPHAGGNVGVVSQQFDEEWPVLEIWRCESECL